ncbi:MAG TPA: GntR family transcriptional regulator [Bacillus bacterium]|nr:GntR family transcriptional regulator [Bacillus sp. (in: firmicutes)]
MTNDDKSVSPNSPVFLYDQVKVEIVEMINKGEFVPGKKLPNEKELCSLFNTSRITIRRALKELANEGVIEILHGKGTYVKGLKQQLHILNLKGFTEGLSAGENTFTKEVLNKEIITADEKLMKIFKRDEPFEVIKLVRMIWDGSIAFSIDFAYLPCDIYPGMYEKIKDNISTFNLIHNEYGIRFKKARKEIEIIQPPLEVSKLLEISRMESVIQVKKVISEEKDIPVHYSTYYLLANRVNFYIDVDMEGES